MTTHDTPENQPAPSLTGVRQSRTVREGVEHIQQSDRPLVGLNGKPSRAARREANRLKRLKTEVAEIAEADIPQAYRLKALAAGEGGQTESAENQPAPSLPGVSLLHAVLRRDSQHQERQHLLGIGALERGRPSEYTDDEADTICSWVMEGGSLRAYCRHSGRASKTVYGWMRENAGFSGRYLRACEDRADSLTDDMIEIADASAEFASIEGVSAAKLRVETRKWIASKLRPQKWGDKQVVEHVGAVNIRIGIPQKPVTVLETVDRLD